MDYHEREMRKCVEKFVAQLGRNCVSLGDGEFGINGDIEFRMQAVP
jgi:hypothetical protein